MDTQFKVGYGECGDMILREVGANPKRLKWFSVLISDGEEGGGSVVATSLKKAKAGAKQLAEKIYREGMPIKVTRDAKI